jgi:hypothetical protein
MIDIVDELNRKWAEASRAGRGGHEWRAVLLSISSPVRLLAAVREPDEKIALLIEAPISAAPVSPLRFETQGLSLKDQRRQAENVFRVAITLERSELRSIFEALCSDLVLIASHESAPSDLIVAVARRLEAWQACLRVRRAGLTGEEQIGLLGELAVLEGIGELAGFAAAAAAWEGPTDGIHDFVQGGIAVEVKSALGIGTLLYVSHLDQLETAGLTRLTIARPRFRQGQDGTSLPEHVKILRTKITATSPGSLAVFDEKLLRAGYLDIDAPLYAETLFIRESIQYYAVDGNFPKITRQSIPTAIVDASYSIDERSISEFLIPRDEFCEMVRTVFEATR